MITKTLLKAEIDNLSDKYLEVLYRIIKALDAPVQPENGNAAKVMGTKEWQQFVEETYGCLADAPIKRGVQGDFEVREDIK